MNFVSSLFLIFFLPLFSLFFFSTNNKKDEFINDEEIDPDVLEVLGPSFIEDCDNELDEELLPARG